MKFPEGIKRVMWKVERSPYHRQHHQTTDSEQVQDPHTVLETTPVQTPLEKVASSQMSAGVTGGA